MSFSYRVKDELAKQIPTARHCQIAELMAIVSFCGEVIQGEWLFIQVTTENELVARKCFTLLQKAFNIETCVLKKKSTWVVTITDEEDNLRVLQALKLIGESENHSEGLSTLADARILSRECCRRAYLRGAFLAVGSISDPEKFYHLEIVCTDSQKAKQIQDLVNTFTMDAKIIKRKKYDVVYLKEGNQIVDLLNIMEAHVALMDLENVRILKEMRNSINRKVNCETANIHKTVSASAAQIEDIIYIRDRFGLESLTENLEEIALARLAWPDATLTELGASLDTPVGKSGVNHRLRKIKAIADGYREKGGEQL